MKRISIIIFVLLFTFSCKDKNPVDPVVSEGILERIYQTIINVPEPSGLSFGPGKNTLLTVSDRTNNIYEMDLQGNLIRIIQYPGLDLEGVTYNPEQNLIAVVDEINREVALIDYDSGQVQGVYQIEIQVVDENNGLEGISYHATNKQYYIVNEKNPEMMVVWTPETGILNEKQLSFAHDYSAVFADSDHSWMWFLSDESKKLYKCDNDINVLTTFDLSEDKNEGLVIENDKVYIVNDSLSTLNIFKIKDY